MKLILLSLLFLATETVLESEADNTLQVVKTIGKGSLYYPAGPIPTFSSGSFVSLDNQKLLLYDSAGLHPFWLIDAENGELSGHGRWGRGPGEFMRESPKIISRTAEHIYIHDVFSHYLHKYTPDMGYVRSYFPELKSNMFATIMMLDDETLLFSDHGINFPGEIASHFFMKYRFNDGEIMEDYLPILPYSSVNELHPVKRNISLKTGPVEVFDGTIYVANLFGSVILAVDKKGQLAFNTSYPDKAEIPPAESRLINGVRVGEPEITTFRNLDLAADRDYLYALYSGETSSFENISNFITGGISEEELRIGEGRLLRVYNRHDGSYLGEFTLPDWAAAITADDNYLYAVTWDDEPHIMVLNKPQF